MYSLFTPLPGDMVPPAGPSALRSAPPPPPPPTEPGHDTEARPAPPRPSPLPARPAATFKPGAPPGRGGRGRGRGGGGRGRPGPGEGRGPGQARPEAAPPATRSWEAGRGPGARLRGRAGRPGCAGGRAPPESGPEVRARAAGGGDGRREERGEEARGARAGGLGSPERLAERGVCAGGRPGLPASRRAGLPAPQPRGARPSPRLAQQLSARPRFPPEQDVADGAAACVPAAAGTRRRRLSPGSRRLPARCRPPALRPASGAAASVRPQGAGRRGSRPGRGPRPRSRARPSVRGAVPVGAVRGTRHCKRRHLGSGVAPQSGELGSPPRQAQSDPFPTPLSWSCLLETTPSPHVGSCCFPLSVHNSRYSGFNPFFLFSTVPFLSTPQIFFKLD